MNKDKTGNERYRRWYYTNLKKIRAERRAKYYELKAAGLCPRCGGSVADQPKKTVLCQDCLSKLEVMRKNRGGI